MGKFERLPLEKRKEEICQAALGLFCEKGFQATTMENIVDKVSLSKGGVYRIYPSTEAILRDLVLSGMRLRNRWYQQQAAERAARGEKLTLEFLAGVIGDSLMLYPEISRVYVEFLWEKQRNPQLQQLYEQICRESTEETETLIRSCGASELLLQNPSLLPKLTELMNAAILSIHVLNLLDRFELSREKLTKAIAGLLE